MAGTAIDVSFEAVLVRLAQEAIVPDLVLLTGDLVDDPDMSVYPAVYQRLIELVRNRFGAGVKLCAIPGNHDLAGSFHSSFAAAAIPTRGSFAIRNWRFCLLDSSIAGSNGGSVATAQLQQLGAIAARYPDQNLAVVLHHPPISINSPWLDTMMVDNADELFAALACCDNIKVCIWGHAHQEWDSLYRGIRQLGSPATCPVQFKPLSATYAVDEQQPPGCRCFTFHSDGRLETQVIRVLT